MDKLINRFDKFESHHQFLVAFFIICGVVLVSWGMENIIEQYIFPHKSNYELMLAIVIGFLMLWLAKHFVLKMI